MTAKNKLCIPSNYRELEFCNGLCDSTVVVEVRYAATQFSMGSRS